MSSSPNGDSAASSCVCAQLYSGTALPTAEKGVLKPPVVSSVNANILADTLGVSPLYRQQDSARWQSAHHVYQSNRAHSPVRNGGGSTPVNQSATIAAVVTLNDGATATFDCVTPHQLHQTYYEQSNSAIGSPISLEDIAFVNRRRHLEVGYQRVHESKAGALELEAVAAVHELACSVKSIFVSEILPRTSDLIFVNIKTHEEVGFDGDGETSARLDGDRPSRLFVALQCRIHAPRPIQHVIQWITAPRQRAITVVLPSNVQVAVYRRAWRQFSCMARFTSRAIPLRARLVYVPSGAAAGKTGQPMATGSGASTQTARLLRLCPESKTMPN